MASDPQAPSRTEELSAQYSAIENEIPAYRAISPLAIASLLLGLLSFFTFVNVWLGIAGVLAIVAGVIAERKIRRYPDMFTGRGLAQAGIALGLVFTLSAVTIDFIQSLVLQQKAKAFGQQYAKILNAKDLADSSYYLMPSTSRQGKTPKKMLDEFLKQNPDPQTQSAYLGQVNLVLDRLKQPKGKVRFVEIENAGYDGLTAFAFALLEVTGPANKNHPAQEYALLELKSLPEDKGNHWYINQILYPYEPKTHALQPKPIDDGHNHSGGHGH